MSSFKIQASVIGDPQKSGPIEFRSKAGGRMRIANQNRQQPSSQRHPAWTSMRGFPRAPDDVANKEEALAYFPDGGLRITSQRRSMKNTMQVLQKGIALRI